MLPRRASWRGLYIANLYKARVFRACVNMHKYLATDGYCCRVFRAQTFSLCHGQLTRHGSMDRVKHCDTRGRKDRGRTDHEQRIGCRRRYAAPGSWGTKGASPTSAFKTDHLLSMPCESSGTSARLFSTDVTSLSPKRGVPGGSGSVLRSHYPLDAQATLMGPVEPSQRALRFHSSVN